MPYEKEVEGQQLQRIFMQTWFPTISSGMGFWWRVDFSKLQHETYQQPLFDDNVAIYPCLRGWLVGSWLTPDLY
jgi:hypothetical protein